MSRRETTVALIILFALFVPGSFLQSMLWYERQSDTAFLSQVTENIGRRGIPVSQVAAGTLAFTERDLQTKTAEEICASPLPPPKPPEFNQFSRHTYFILYALAPLTWFTSSHVLWPSLMVFSFLAMLFLVYSFLRRGGIGPLGAVAFTVLVSCHPAWSESLFGQTYVEKLFAILGPFLLFSIAKHPSRPRWILVAILLCLSLAERTGVLCGTFLVGYVVLYRSRLSPHERRLYTAVGVGCFIVSWVLIKLVVNHTTYSSFLPTGPADVLRQFSRPIFLQNAIVFLVLNLLLLFFAAFEWRALVLALVMMGPNILGDIGGAEKVGWSTHYHSLYFPFLVWAATLGFIRFHKAAAARILPAAIAAVVTVLAVVLAGLQPYALKDMRFSWAHVREQAFLRTLRTLPAYWGRNRDLRLEALERLRRAIPEGSSVTMPESLMPALYKNRNIYLFPVGLDVVNYAVLPCRREGDAIRYSGTVSYTGAENIAKLDKCLVDRMKTTGFDFNAPIFIDKYGIAVLRRNRVL